MGCRIDSGKLFTCDEMRLVGGAQKKCWVVNTEDISSYAETNGYVSALTLDTYGYLYKFEAKQFSFNANTEQFSAAPGGSVGVNHTVTMKFFNTDADTDAIIESFLGANVTVFLLTNNDEIKIYGLKNGLYASEGVQNQGEELNADVTYLLTLTGAEKGLPKRFSAGGTGTDLAASIALLETYEE